jgi:hypothetical protein
VGVFVFSVVCIVCTVFLYCIVYVYLFLFVLLPPSENSTAVSKNNKNNNYNYILSVSVALVIQYAKRMRRYYIFICGLVGCTSFFPHYPTNGEIFGKKLLVIKCVLIYSTTFV